MEDADRGKFLRMVKLLDDPEERKGMTNNLTTPVRNSLRFKTTLLDLLERMQKEGRLIKNNFIASGMWESELKNFEIVVCSLTWEGSESTALFFHDLSHQQKILSL